MPKIVEVPGLGNVEFPDSMSDTQIASAIETDILPKIGQGSAPTGRGGVLPSLAEGFVTSFTGIPLGIAGLYSATPEETALGKFSTGAEKVVQDILGIDPTKEATTAEAVAGGLGSLASFLVPGTIVAKGARALGTGVAGARAAGMVGAGAQAVPLGAAEQIQRRMGEEAATGVETTAEDRLASQRLGGAIGLTELVPLRRFMGPLEAILARVPIAKAGGAAKAVEMGVKRALGAATEEGAQEALAQTAQNLVEQGYYNPDLDITEGLLSSAGVGGAAGGTLDVILQLMAGRKASKMRTAFTQLERENARQAAEKKPETIRADALAGREELLRNAPSGEISITSADNTETGFKYKVVDASGKAAATFNTKDAAFLAAEQYEQDNPSAVKFIRPTIAEAARTTKGKTTKQEKAQGKKIAKELKAAGALAPAPAQLPTTPVGQATTGAAIAETVQQVGATPTQAAEIAAPAVPKKGKKKRIAPVEAPAPEGVAPPPVSTTAAEIPAPKTYGEIAKEESAAGLTIGDFQVSFEDRNGVRYARVRSKSGKPIYQKPGARVSESSVVDVWGVEDPTTVEKREGAKVGIREVGAYVPEPFRQPINDWLSGKIDQTEAEKRIKATPIVRPAPAAPTRKLSAVPTPTAPQATPTAAPVSPTEAPPAAVQEQPAAKPPKEYKPSLQALFKPVVTAPEGVQKLQEFEAKKDAVSKALNARLAPIVGKNVRIQLDDVVRQGKGIAEGAASPAGDVIYLSYNLYDPNLTTDQMVDKLFDVMNHEVIHSLSNLGLFKGNELSTLFKAAERIKYQGNQFTYYDRAERMYATVEGYRNPDGSLNEEMIHEEAVAEMFRDARAGKLKLEGTPKGVFGRIVEFFKRLFNGYRDAKVGQIFKDIEAGKIGTREARAVERGVRKLSAVPQDISKEADKAFKKLAGDQRGSPELLMVEAQNALRGYESGPALTYAMEHVGDLTHRMGQYGNEYPSYEFGIEFVAPKVRTGLRVVTNRVDAERIAKLPDDPILKKYADAHSKLKVYNEAQRAARDAAVALGRKDLKEAERNLLTLQEMIDNGTYVEIAGSYDPQFEGGVRKLSALPEDEKTKLRLARREEKLARAKEVIDYFYNENDFPRHPYNKKQVAFGLEGTDGFIIFELEPETFRSPDGAGEASVHVKWFQAHPMRSGIGKKGMEIIQERAAKAGVPITLEIYEKGVVGSEGLIKFYKKMGFRPRVKGDNRFLIWRPEEQAESRKLSVIPPPSDETASPVSVELNIANDIAETAAKTGEASQADVDLANQSVRDAVRKLSTIPQVIPMPPEMEDANKRIFAATHVPSTPGEKLMGVLGGISSREGIGRLADMFRVYYVQKTGQITKKEREAFLTGALNPDEAQFAEYSATQAADMMQRSSHYTVEAAYHGAPVIRGLNEKREAVSISEGADPNSAYMYIERDQADSPLKVLEKIITGGPGGGDLTEQFRSYAVAQVSKRRLSEGKEIPEDVTPEYINAADALAEQYPIIKEAFESYQRFNTKLLEAVRDSGYLSQELFEEFTDQQNYYSMYRQLEEGDVVQEISGGIASRIRFKPYEGSTTGNLMADPIVAMMHNVAFWNNVILRTLATQKAFRVGEATGVVKRLRSFEDEDGNVTTETPSRADGFDDKTFYTYINGVEVPFASRDPLFTIGLSGNDFASPSLFLELAGMPANFLREMVTRDPGFMVANLMRDSVSTWVLAGSGANPFQTFKGFVSALNSSASFEALRSYGVVGSFDEAQKPMAKIVAGMRKKLTKVQGLPNMTSALTGAWDKLGSWSEASDAATRIAVYDAAKRDGASDFTAAYRALSIMNFSRSGHSAGLRMWTRMVPFLNARIQGFDVLYTGMKAAAGVVAGREQLSFERQRGTHVLVRGMALTAAAMALSLFLDDDEDYQQLPQYIKDANILIPIPGQKGQYFQIPKPFEAGFLFMTVPQTFYDVAMGNRSMRSATKLMFNQFSSTFGFNPIPQAALPIVENMINRDFYTGQPLVSPGMEQLDPSLQYNASTSYVARGLSQLSGFLPFNYDFEEGRFVPISPIKLDNLISGYGGPIMSYIGMGIGGAAYMFGSDNQGLPVAGSQLPVIRRFFVDARDKQPQAATEAYELYQLVDKVNRTISRLKKMGDTEALREYREENINVLRVGKQVRKMADNLNNIRAQIRRLEADKVTPMSQKLEKLRELRSREARVTQRIDEINQQLGR